MFRKLIFCAVIMWFAVCDAKFKFKRSLVMTSTETQKYFRDTPEITTVPAIYEMRIDTNVSNRYAKTLITSKVKNFGSKAQEAIFTVVTPEKSFISGFTMEIDGKRYDAYVKEKAEAKRTYDQALSRGQTAGHVAVNARDSNRFTVSVNIEAQTKATFYLTYEELLVRKDDKYEVVLNIHPGQPVKTLAVQVNIIESRPLKFVKTPSLRSGNEVLKNNPQLDPEADIKTTNKTSAVVTFNPDVARQKVLASSLGGKEDDGLNGQFVVQYDVERDSQGGEILVNSGYFVHFFAPEDITPLKKQVVFVLDSSGSMFGTRIMQLKQAMRSILSELKSDDIFSIVEFNTNVIIWNISPEKVTYSQNVTTERTTEVNEPNAHIPSIEASEENIIAAKKVIEQLTAYGGTNIQSALKRALEIVEKTNQTSHQPMIVFLTDGDPTVGELSTEKIVSTITKLNNRKIPIFCLSFGDGADRSFLRKLSLKNQGFARHIYEAADAHIQLENFYKQISSPLLSNVTFKYTDKVRNVTRSHFPILFCGAELYVSGIITDPQFNPPNVDASGVNGPIQLKPNIYEATGSLERLWAYLTVKQLLENRQVVDNKEDVTKEALRLALKYSFVTDVSSLVVVKPNSTSDVNTEDAAKPQSYAARKVASRPYPVSFSARKVASRPYPVSFSARKVASRPYPVSFSGGRRSYFSARKVASRPYPVSFDADLSGPQAGYPRKAAQFLSVDLNLYAPTTTFIPATEKASDETDMETLSSTKQPVVDFPNIPWLRDILNDNGTITLESGTYSLGLGETVLPQQSCQNSINNTSGYCTVLTQCLKIHLQLTDFETYKKYFCKIQSFAGICCPDPLP